MFKIDQRIVIVIRKTRIDELAARFSTKSHARFMVKRARVAQAFERSGGKASLHDLEQIEDSAIKEIKSVEKEGEDYQNVIASLRTDLDFDLPIQVIDRSLLPNMAFGPKDIVVTVGQDGLVANAAKYAIGLPIVGVNPDPAKYDGVLLPFEAKQARAAVQRVLENRAKVRNVTLAEARLNDGQRLLAFNDLFIGARTHVSARYRLEAGGRIETQSSSGMIVSTGAGSTGWLSSVLNMAQGVMNLSQEAAAKPVVRLNWEDRKLIYVVREPFISRTTRATHVAGVVEQNGSLVVESLMGSEGTIFSDGVEADFLAFGEGAIATIGVAKETAKLVIA